MPISLTFSFETEAELTAFMRKISFEDLMSSTSNTKIDAEKHLLGSGKSSLKKPSTQTKAPNRSKRSVKRGDIQLTDLIQSAIEQKIKAKKPFRGRDVVTEILKKNPSLNEGSVTTATFKALGQTSLKSTQIKERVGRPYRLYTP